MVSGHSTPSRPNVAVDDHEPRRSAYLLQGARADEPVIHIKIGRNPVLHLNVEEAEIVRDFIDMLLTVDTGEDAS